MKTPEHELDDRSILWQGMQCFWMDSDPQVELQEVARVCAESKYSLQELEEIFWNEVRPAVGSNLLAGPAPHWAGYETQQLRRLVLEKHRHGRPIRVRWLYPYSRSWWRKLEAAIRAIREAEGFHRGPQAQPRSKA